MALHLSLPIAYNVVSHMKATKPPTDSNDYAVARALNDCVMQIFSIVGFYQIIGPLKEFNPVELNRMYILLVAELEDIYNRNPKLAEIKPEPTWKQFEIIKNSMYAVQKYLEAHDNGREHRDAVDKICILSGEEAPEYTPKQRKLIDDTGIIAEKYYGLTFDAVKEIAAKNSDKKKALPARFWYIPEYTIIYKLDGTILINNALKLKKIHAGSTTERLLEQAIKNPGALFKPNLGATSRNLSTVLSAAGFTPTMRALFFPIVNEGKGIVFRPEVTRDKALADKIDTFKLDMELAEAGAYIKIRPTDELVALGIAAPDEPD